MSDAAANAVRAQSPQHAHAVDAPTVDALHPWLGLASFTEETRSYFHGRDAEVTRAQPYYTPDLMDDRSPINWIRKIEVPMFLAVAWQDEQTGAGFASMLFRAPRRPDVKLTATNGVHSSTLDPEIMWNWMAFLDLYVAGRVPVWAGIGAIAVGAVLLPWVLPIDWRAGLVLGGAIAMSSTAIVIKMLADRLELDSTHGRQIVGIVLFQDLAVVPLLILVPAGFVAARIIPPLMTRAARMHSDEMFLLVALAVGLGTAALTQAAGL